MKITIFTLTLLLIISCADKEAPHPWEVDKNKVRELLSSSTDTIKVENTTMVLNTQLLRNRKSKSLVSGSLSSMTSLTDIDSVQIPEQIKLVKQYVINGDSLWEAAYEDRIYVTDPYILQKISLNGPEWQGDRMTVVVEIQNMKTDSNYFIKSENLSILSDL